MHLIIKTDSSNYVIITINTLRLEQKNMKLTTIAKATLALGILTTVVFTAESQTGHAKVELDETQRKYYINMLHQYYSEESFEPTNISVKSEDYYGSNVLNFKQRNKAFKVFLLGDDKNKYKEKHMALMSLQYLN